MSDYDQGRKDEIDHSIRWTGRWAAFWTVAAIVMWATMKAGLWG